jgi:PPOX class probable F420-dependent enzyme
MTATIDASSPKGARALARLDTELIGWLTTINPDGQPQSSPVWFLWVDGELLVYSGKRAPRNANLEDRSLVAFNLNTDAVGDDVLTVEGVARIDPGGAPASANPAYLAKYSALLAEYDWTAEYFSGEYPVVVRVTPTRWRVA